MLESKDLELVFEQYSCGKRVKDDLGLDRCATYVL